MSITEPVHDERPEVVSLLRVVPPAGPPVVLVAGPLVLFPLLITGPVLLILTLFVLAACASLIALAGAIVASPHLVVRRLGGERQPRRRPRAQLAPVNSRRSPA